MKPFQIWCRTAVVAGLFVLIGISFSCGFGGKKQDICNCLALEPDIADYRHSAKHVPLPDLAPQEITVDTMLSWPQDIIPLPADAPRAGRELQLFHIASAFLQFAHVNTADCDISMEISATADKSAPRVTVETPVDSEYCSARRGLQSQLAQHGFTLDAQHGGELPQALPIDVLGLAFEDFEHNRGDVATLWELHPAVVKITP